MREKIKSLIEEGAAVQKRMLSGTYIKTIEKIAGILINSLKKGGKIIIFGNGGSAADAEHMACELVGRFKRERIPLAAIALTSNTSSLTAISNDYGYDDVFSRQISALGKKGDAAVCISTSGNSKNVLNAVLAAKKIGMPTIALTGKGGGKVSKVSRISLIVPSKETPRIQESHIAVIHVLCGLIEDAFVEPQITQSPAKP